MSNSSAMCSSFKKELLTGHHNFGAGVVRASIAADTFKAALYLATANLGEATASYTAVGEVVGTNYVAGGLAIANSVPPAVASTTAYWTPSASILWATVTLADAFDAVLIYNASQSNRAVSVHMFGSQTVTAGNFSLTMPVNTSEDALLRIA